MNIRTLATVTVAVVLLGIAFVPQNMAAVFNGAVDQVRALAGNDSKAEPTPGVANATEQVPVAPNKRAKRTKRQNRLNAASPGALGMDTGRNSHAFITEARWNPCAPVEFIYNPENAPKGAVDDLHVAIEKTAAATGFTMTLKRTNAAPNPNWAKIGGLRPVLVNWGKPGTGVLDDEHVSATAEPIFEVNSRGQSIYVSGQITINTEHDMYDPGFGTYLSRTAMYMHEVAHILGLDHVDDHNQLMHDKLGGTRDFGAGDLAGLAKLNTGACLTLP